MNSTILNCSLMDVNILIRLIIAHLLADFIFQSSNMATNKCKTLFNRTLLYHILIVFACTYTFSGFNIYLTVLITLSHVLIDVAKTFATVRYVSKRKQNDFQKNRLTLVLFSMDQLAHIASIIGIWIYFANSNNENFLQIVQYIKAAFMDYKISLYLLGYIICSFPAAILINLLIKGILVNNNSSTDNNNNVQNGGKWIGIAERLIIITFVYLQSYESIGFLITGKSIIRFADTQKMHSEYVLLGTMLSYATSILTGVGINWLINQI